MLSRPRLFALLAVTLSSAVLIACSSANKGQTGTSAPTHSPVAVENPVYPGADWETASPEDEGMTSAPLENLSPYCVEHGCRAVVVIHGGKIVWEHYWNGWTQESTDNSWSVAKSFTSALVGIAMHDGKIKGLDEPAVDFIPEWKGSPRDRITIGQLLSMTSGLKWAMVYIGTASGDSANMMASADQVTYAVNRDLYRAPGTDWYYSDGDAELFSRIIKAATGMQIDQYAKQKLFDPIGIQDATWMKDAKGQPMTYCCIMDTARDFARFGYLFLRKGQWEDQQIVPVDWVETSTQPSQTENINYGYYWWLYDFPDIPTDMYAGMGMGTKRIYVIPSLDIVAVRLGDNDLTWDDGSFLKPIVEAVTNGG
jgi:CubicO group peptidase (beta-lactamase class C family)